MLYDRVIVVGTGSIACKCTKILCELTKKENIFVVEYCENDISILCYWCKENEIEYYVGNKASNIEQYLKNIIGEYDALIISVNNLHIFSKDIVNSENVRIANFHYSLLPRYRGCNIPTWVVYNGECNTGVTWHFVGNKIDCGKIIAQKKIEIHESTTAQNIIKEGMKVGIELFASSIEQILSKNVDLEEENQVLEKYIKKMSCRIMGIWILKQILFR